MTPAEVLAAHRERRVLVSGFMESRCEGDDCGWLGPVDDWPAHVLDALTKAGHVLVTLPEPDVDNGRQKVWTSSIGDVIVGKYMGVLIDWTDNDDSPTPGELRAHAAAALAAAAETGGKA